MSLATHTERRTRLREMLAAKRITIPGSVFDPTSARLAREAGYEMGLLGGSVASAVVLGAPDIVLLTLSDFVDQVRRVTRFSDICLMADADHGYGNSLNVRRTVQDLEAAGVTAMSIEDTLLPRRFGGTEGELISREEFSAKLRAAMDAKTDPSLVLVGRTAGLTAGGVDGGRGEIALTIDGQSWTLPLREEHRQAHSGQRPREQEAEARAIGLRQRGGGKAALPEPPAAGRAHLPAEETGEGGRDGQRQKQ